MQLVLFVGSVAGQPFTDPVLLADVLETVLVIEPPSPVDELDTVTVVAPPMPEELERTAEPPNPPKPLELDTVTLEPPNPDEDVNGGAEPVLASVDVTKRPDVLEAASVMI